MKQFFAVIAVTICTLLMFTSCKTAEVSLKNNDKKLIDLVDHFAESDMKIDSIQQMESEFFHAEEALALKISKRDVGIYRFDLNYHNAKRKVESVKKTGKFYIQAKPFDAMMNGSFMIIDYKRHPRKDDIIKAFNSFE